MFKLFNIYKYKTNFNYYTLQLQEDVALHNSINFNMKKKKKKKKKVIVNDFLKKVIEFFNIKFYSYIILYSINCNKYIGKIYSIII